MEPIFFSQQADFRKWLEKYHEKASELLVGFYKTGSGKPSMTWSESVDEALCFGWIDGVRKSIGPESYAIRFTPRKPSSIWSMVNIKKVAILSRSGRMHPAGIAAYNQRKESKSGIYAHEQSAVSFSPELERIFKANRKAWKFFQSLAPSYRKSSVNWIMSAKQAATQLKRLRMLISDSEAGMNQWKDNKYMKK